MSRLPNSVLRFARLLQRVGRQILAYGDQEEVWFDVGAHLGETTFLHAQARPLLTVYAFEPNLRLAVQRMGVLPNFKMMPMAVAEHDGYAEFNIADVDTASSLLTFNPEGVRSWAGAVGLSVARKISVATVRIDTFMDLMGISRIEYMKVDAQGADLSVLKSAGKRLADIHRIMLEVQVSSTPLYAGASKKEETVAYLKAAGFRLVRAESQQSAQEENLTFVNANVGSRCR